MKNNIVRFNKCDRSTFPYWFAHWCAFQMTALNLGCWEFRFLFHDLLKPFAKLFFDYKTVQKSHKTHEPHHLHAVVNGIAGDWVGMIVDWECSRFTKQQSPLNAADTYDKEFSELETFILTYKTNGNLLAEYIRDNVPYGDSLADYNFRMATILKNSYDSLHLTFDKLGIPHKYRTDYLNEYFNDRIKHKEIVST